MTFNADDERRKATALWITEFELRWFATYTFRSKTNLHGANTAMRKYGLSLSEKSGTDVYGFYFVEFAGIDGRTHLHALLGNTGHLPICCGRGPDNCKGCGRHLWRRGWSSIRRFNPAKAGIWYTTKSIGHGLGELEILGTPQFKNISIEKAA